MQLLLLCLLAALPCFSRPVSYNSRVGRRQLVSLDQENSVGVVGEPCMEIARSYKYECNYIRGPVRPQCCCTPPPFTQLNNGTLIANLESGVNFTCFPSFFVIGAQKSGSSALEVYLAQHPRFASPLHKEIHFFDLGYTMYFNQSAFFERKYAAAFPKYQSLANASNFLTADITPSYILDVRSARNIKDYHSNSPLVLILRNPIDRAYSEYQMKVRRLEAQFNSQNPLHKTATVNEIINCYSSANLTKETPINKVLNASELHVRLRTCLLHRLRSLFQANHWTEKGAFSITGCLPTTSFPSDSLLTKCLSPPYVRHDQGEPFEQMLMKEMEFIINCTQNEKTLQRGKDSVTDFKSYRMMWGVRACYEKGLMNSVDRDFLARGLYLPQIEIFHSQFPREQLLIISDSDLLSHPVETMNKVFAHVGLPPFTVPTLAYKDIGLLVETHWSGFEASSGWSAHGDYTPMSESLRQTLRTFYEPHNKRLFSYLGRDFNWQ